MGITPAGARAWRSWSSRCHCAALRPPSSSRSSPRQLGWSTLLSSHPSFLRSWLHALLVCQATLAPVPARSGAPSANTNTAQPRWLITHLFRPPASRVSARSRMCALRGTSVRHPLRHPSPPIMHRARRGDARPLPPRARRWTRRHRPAPRPSVAEATRRRVRAWRRTRGSNRTSHLRVARR